MKKLILTLIVALALWVGQANATNIRGQLVRNIGGKYQPLSNVRVDLMVWNGRAWSIYSYAITGQDGFYYFINFPPGLTFCVSVMGHYYPNQPLMVQSLAPQYYQDVPAIST
jgi:hypothetical protein